MTWKKKEHTLAVDAGFHGLIARLFLWWSHTFFLGFVTKRGVFRENKSGTALELVFIFVLAVFFWESKDPSLSTYHSGFCC